MCEESEREYAESAAGFGLQTAPVVLLREAFAGWPR
jgi:hypothetical protein